MKWNLRLAAAQRDIWKASQLHGMLTDAGLVISAGKMSHLWSSQPVTIRTCVTAAVPQLVVVEANAQIARAAHARGQRLAIGSNSSTNTVAAGLAATVRTGQLHA